MKRNYTIDFIKFIFSFFIIAIHVSLFKEVNTSLYHITTMGLFRIAVPFFFVVSGYYFYQRIQENKDTKNYLKRLIKLFVLFEFIEVLLFFIPMALWGQFDFIINNIYKIVTTGVGGSYWYLISLIISLIILKPLWKKKNIHLMLVIGLILYIITMSNDAYSSILSNTFLYPIAKWHSMIWTWPQAGLCSSLLYLSLGAMVYEYKPKIKYLSLYLLISICLLVFEALLLQGMGAYDANCYYSLIISTPLLFIFVLENDFISFNTRKLGLMSTYIYVIHQMVLTVLRFIYPFTSEILFVLGSIISFFISYLIVKKGA